MKFINISTPSHPDTFAMVDDEDFDRLNQWKWTAEKRRNGFYAMRVARVNGKKRTVRMHVEVLGPGADIDHRDGNGLNNQRANLRRCTPAENGWNVKKLSQRGKTSRFKGVSWSEKYCRWNAHIGLNGGKRNLGCYPSEELAAAAYNFAALDGCGEFAQLNDVRGISREQVDAARFRGNKRLAKTVPPTLAADAALEGVLREFER
jgi:hypothetical protein